MDLRAADRNFVETWRNVVRSGPRHGDADGDGVVLLSSGVPVGLFNPAFVMGTPADDGALVDRVVAHYGRLELPFVLYFRDDIAPQLGERCEAAGLVEHFRPPLMVLDPIPEHPSAPRPDDLAIDSVTAANIEQYGEVLAAGFGMPPELVGALLGSTLLGIETFTGFLGTVDGTPVASSGVFVSDGVAGVYNVATIPEARGQGYGAALTWAAVFGGQRPGVTGSVLQASAEGEPVYRRMGFETLDRYRQFEPAR